MEELMSKWYNDKKNRDQTINQIIEETQKTNHAGYFSPDANPELLAKIAAIIKSDALDDKINELITTLFDLNTYFKIYNGIMARYHIIPQAFSSRARDKHTLLKDMKEYSKMVAKVGQLFADLGIETAEEVTTFFQTYYKRICHNNAFNLKYRERDTSITSNIRELISSDLAACAEKIKHDDRSSEMDRAFDSLENENENE